MKVTWLTLVLNQDKKEEIEVIEVETTEEDTKDKEEMMMRMSSVKKTPNPLGPNLEIKNGEMKVVVEEVHKTTGTQQLLPKVVTKKIHKKVVGEQMVERSQVKKMDLTMPVKEPVVAEVAGAMMPTKQANHKMMEVVGEQTEYLINKVLLLIQSVKNDLNRFTLLFTFTLYLSLKLT